VLNKGTVSDHYLYLNKILRPKLSGANLKYLIVSSNGLSLLIKVDINNLQIQKPTGILCIISLVLLQVLIIMEDLKQPLMILMKIDQLLNE